MKIKQLEWQGIDYPIAYNPAAPRRGEFEIFYEQNKWWAGWDLSIPGMDNLDDLKALAQESHNNFIKGFIEE